MYTKHALRDGGIFLRHQPCNSQTHCKYTTSVDIQNALCKAVVSHSVVCDQSNESAKAENSAIEQIKYIYHSMNLLELGCTRNISKCSTLTLHHIVWPWMQHPKVPRTCSRWRWPYTHTHWNQNHKLTQMHFIYQNHKFTQMRFIYMSHTAELSQIHPDKRW